MKSILVEINCPTCMWHTHKPSDTLIIPEFEPDLKEQLQKNTFYCFTCPRCGTRIAFFHTCIYPDKKHNFILYMKAIGERKEEDHSLYANMNAVKRYIGNAQDIPEKLLILEEGLDDRVIEILKVKLFLHAKKSGRKLQAIRYYDYDMQSQTLWFCVTENNEDTMQAVLWHAYEKIKGHLPKQDNDRFQQVDLTWATQHML